MEEKLEQIFNSIAKEESLNGEEGHAKVMDLIFEECKFPEGFERSDVESLLESIETPSEFAKESFIAHYTEILGVLRQEIIPEPELPDPEDEEALRLSSKFIAERLSDLQPLDEGQLNFAFTTFCVSEAEIVDIEALSAFKGLSDISLHTNLISSASALNGMERLSNLNMAENRLVSFDGISLPALKTLDLSQNKFAAVTQLQTPVLENLNLSQNAIRFISPSAFSKLSNILVLDLSQNKLNSIRKGVFDGLKTLKTLHLDQNQITSLPGGIFSGLSELEELTVAENPIENIEGLSDLESLKKINLSGTSVPDFEKLKVLTAAKKLNTLITEGIPAASGETYRSDVILSMPWVEVIDEEPITFAERQEAEQLDKERKEQEEQERLEREEAERQRIAEEEAATAEGKEEGEKGEDENKENENNNEDESATETDSQYTTETADTAYDSSYE